MSRPKRSSKALDHALRRFAAVKAIGASLNLGNGVTVESFATAIELTQEKLESYNSSLATVDAAQDALESAEKSLLELTEHILVNVAARYGKDSEQYKMAGGVRKSERKRPTRKPKEVA